MAISTHFQTEMNVVDATKVLNPTVDAVNYTLFQWSYDGLDIVGGSDLACEYGASELMEAMGFRWYAPTGNNFRKYPVSIPTDLVAAKQQFWMPNCNDFLVYGHSWDNVHAALRNQLNNAYNKWQTLTSLLTNIYPAGHRWGNVVSSNLPFFQANTQLIQNGSAGLASPSSAHFDLVGITNAITEGVGDNRTVVSWEETEDWFLLIHICAAHLLNQGLNAWQRTNFDPSDGDNNPSDLVFPFTKAVAEMVRAGTSPIGTIGAKTGVANAQIGLYAYAGHRLPPSATVAPEVYTQVALAFNDTPLTYRELVQQHGAKTSAIMLREYKDTQVWSHSRPWSGKSTDGALNAYLDYVSYGAVGATSECTANWMVMAPGYRYANRFFKTGTYTLEDAREEIVADIFDDDPAVLDLYEFWGDASRDYNLFNLRKSFDIVDDMVDSWYKTHFETYLTIIKHDHYKPSQIPLAQQTEEDPFPAAFSKLMGMVTAAAADDIIHSYAFMRQRANAAVATNYPELRYSGFNGVRPDWFTNAANYAATHQDFVDAHAELTADTPRPAELDEEDRVIVTNIVPEVSTLLTPATEFYTEGRAKYSFWGPGKVWTQANGQAATVTSYGPGEHLIVLSGSYTVWADSYFLFLSTHPSVRKDPDGTGRRHWFYIPQRVAGQVKLWASSRWRFFDANGQLNVGPTFTGEFSNPANLGPGMVAVDNGNTRGTIENYNCNEWLSLHPNIMLLSRSIATEDFPASSKIKLAA